MKNKGSLDDNRGSLGDRGLEIEKAYAPGGAGYLTFFRVGMCLPDFPKSLELN